MMFVGYVDRESDSVQMWDMRTSRVVVSCDVIWLKRMFFNDDASGIIDLDTLENLENELGPELVVGLGGKDEHCNTCAGPINNHPDEPGGRVTWGNPIVPGPGAMRTTRAGHIIKPPDRLTYAPAVELRFLGEMAELDHGELANMYLALQSMEMALIRAGVGGGMKHTSQLTVLNYKKALRSPDADEWRKGIRNE